MQQGTSFSTTIHRRPKEGLALTWYAAPGVMRYALLVGVPGVPLPALDAIMRATTREFALVGIPARFTGAVDIGSPVGEERQYALLAWRNDGSMAPVDTVQFHPAAQAPRDREYHPVLPPALERTSPIAPVATPAPAPAAPVVVSPPAQGQPIDRRKAAEEAFEALMAARRAGTSPQASPPVPPPPVPAKVDPWDVLSAGTSDSLKEDPAQAASLPPPKAAPQPRASDPWDVLGSPNVPTDEAFGEDAASDLGAGSGKPVTPAEPQIADPWDVLSAAATRDASPAESEPAVPAVDASRAEQQWPASAPEPVHHAGPAAPPDPWDLTFLTLEDEPAMTEPVAPAGEAPANQVPSGSELHAAGAGAADIEPGMRDRDGHPIPEASSAPEQVLLQPASSDGPETPRPSPVPPAIVYEAVPPARERTAADSLPSLTELSAPQEAASEPSPLPERAALSTQTVSAPAQEVPMDVPASAASSSEIPQVTQPASGTPLPLAASAATSAGLTTGEGVEGVGVRSSSGNAATEQTGKPMSREPEPTAPVVDVRVEVYALQPKVEGTPPLHTETAVEQSTRIEATDSASEPATAPVQQPSMAGLSATQALAHQSAGAIAPAEPALADNVESQIPEASHRVPSDQTVTALPTLTESETQAQQTTFLPAGDSIVQGAEAYSLEAKVDDGALPLHNEAAIVSNVAAEPEHVAEFAASYPPAPSEQESSAAVDTPAPVAPELRMPGMAETALAADEVGSSYDRAHEEGAQSLLAGMTIPPMVEAGSDQASPAPVSASGEDRVMAFEAPPLVAHRTEQPEAATDLQEREPEADVRTLDRHSGASSAESYTLQDKVDNAVPLHEEKAVPVLAAQPTAGAVREEIGLAKPSEALAIPHDAAFGLEGNAPSTSIVLDNAGRSADQSVPDAQAATTQQAPSGTSVPDMDADIWLSDDAAPVEEAAPPRREEAPAQAVPAEPALAAPAAILPPTTNEPLSAAVAALLDEAELYLLPQWADFAEVSRLLDMAAETSPNHVRVRALRAQLVEAQGGAHVDVEKMLRDAEQLLAEQDYWEAVDLFEKVLSHQPDHIAARDGASRARVLARWSAQLSGAGSDAARLSELGAEYAASAPDLAAQAYGAAFSAKPAIVTLRGWLLALAHHTPPSSLETHARTAVQSLDDAGTISRAASQDAALAQLGRLTPASTQTERDAAIEQLIAVLVSSARH